MRHIFSVLFLSVLSIMPACAQSSTDQGAAEQMVADKIEGPSRVAPASMEDVRLSFAPVVDQAAPAVVNIYTKRVSQRRSSGDPFFDRFFGRMTPREQNSLGSGVIVSPDGVVVTNNHVIEGMTEIKVVFADRREFEAEVLLTDDKTDLAILRIDVGEPLPFLEFANSDAAEVGDIVLAIGNPFGVGQTVTNGIISALARTAVSISDYQFFIQTDAAINPGNSGGALIDVDGKLIGVNTAIYSRSGGSNGIGFAIPARLVQQVLASAVSGGSLERPWLGAKTDTITPEMARAIDLDRPAGAIISDLYKDGPADKAGLREGDVITQIDGKPVYDAETLRYRVGIRSEKEVAKIEFVREGNQKSASIALGLPPETPAPDPRSLEGQHPLTGVSIANLSPKFNEEFGINPLLEGVVITEVPRRSYASRKGIRRGYRIVSVNGKTVKSTKQLERELANQARSWTFEVDTGDRIVPWRVGR